MDEDQEMERFSMDNDYDDGQWIDGEFYGKRRQKHVQTKEDILYGVFADGDSDSDYEGSGSRKRRRDLGRTDYTKPVNFVSTGSVLPSQEIDRNVEDKDFMAEDDIRPSGLGLGASSGLGFGSASSRVKDEGADEDDNLLQTPFEMKIREGAQLRREREKERSVLAKKSHSSRKESGSAGVGTFEKHTKGIGMKLLEKMGYKGGGLGRNEQGILTPIEAKLRPKNMGMGFNDYKEVSAQPPFPDSVEKPSVAMIQSAENRSKEKQWSKSSKKKKSYITAEELLVQKQGHSRDVIEKVFDMRGPQVRVLTNLENLNAEEKARENDVPMPELQHNLRLMVDLAELDIQKLDQDLRNENETVVALQREKEKLQKEANQQKQQLSSMEEIIRVLDEIEEKRSLGTLTLESLAQSFMDMQKRFPDEYTLCNLSSIACSHALPLLIRIFQGWDPLQNPTHGLEVVSQWRRLLQGQESFKLSFAASPYVQLLMEVVFPAVRICGTNSWQAREPEPMLRFVESWDEFLPAPVQQTILDNVIMPKISAAVDSWDPRRETIPIHSWIHPWLPLLGNKLETCYHTIRHKLVNVLHAWHPSDKSAHYILSPWKNVFDATSWERLMVQCIIPKLLTVMHEFQINPANQNPEPFYWIRTWLTSIPTNHMLQLMDIFFNKWQEVLYHWLCSKPNFSEVEKWYLGWKEELPPELQANDHIRYRLNLGLQMMSQAVLDMEVAPPGLKENISYLRAREQRQFETQKKSAAQAPQRPSTGLDNGVHAEDMPEMSLKEAVEVYAQQNGLLFKPKPGRTRDGHQVYGFGNISVVVDSLNQMILAQTGEKWSSVSLKQLLELHSRSRGKGL